MILHLTSLEGCQTNKSLWKLKAQTFFLSIVTAAHRLPPGVNRTGNRRIRWKIIKEFFTHIRKCSTDISVFTNNKLFDTGRSRSQRYSQKCIQFRNDKRICEMLRPHWEKKFSVFKWHMKNYFCNLRHIFIIFSISQPNKKSLFYGQEQMFIKDCTLILGFSSRSGSTFVFPVLCPARSPCRWHYPGAPGQPSLGGVWPLARDGRAVGWEKGWASLLARLEYSSHWASAPGFPPLSPSASRSSWYLNIICQFP